MLIRLVHLHFRPESVARFERLFEEASPTIRAFEGCLHLELWRDLDDASRFSTYSLWAHAEALERYRQSAFFARTWRETKALFASPAKAHSYSARPLR